MAYFIEGEDRPVYYLANYRVASVATATTLLNMGAIPLGEHHDPIPDDIEIEDNAVIVQTVRHHCDVISSFWYKRQKGKTLQEFVDLILQDEYQYLPKDGFFKRFNNVNHIMRYESLQHEFDNLCIIAGLPVTDLKVTDTDRPQDVTASWQRLFTPDLLEKICNNYSEEMELLGYGDSK